MNVKIDTKEKFHEIWLLEAQLTANMTAELVNLLTDFLNQPVKNVILVMDNTEKMDPEIAKTLAELQNSFYEQSSSFVVSGLRFAAQETLDKLELLEGMNITPTLSEAWDIVQMEEIEREMLDNF